MSPEPVLDALACVLSFLERQKVSCMLIGGLAVRVLGLPRPTYDLDLMLAVDLTDAKRLLAAAEQEGFSVQEAHTRGFVDYLGGLPKVWMGVPIDDRVVDVDLFLAATPYTREAFARRTPTAAPSLGARVCSAEDLLLLKLLAYRLRDQSDIHDLLLVTGPMDGAYLRRWAAEFGIADRLEAALKEAGRSD